MSERIAVIHSHPSWLGLTEKWLYTIIRNLPECIDSHIVSNETRNESQFPLPNVHSLRENSKFSYTINKFLSQYGIRRYPSLLAEVAAEYGAQILHSHYGPMGWNNLAAAKKLGIVHIVNFYGYDIGYLPNSDKRWSNKYAKMFEEADLVLCEGSHMAESIRKLGCNETKIKVQRIGIDTDEIKFSPRAWDGKEPLRVMIAGTFKEKKGIPYAVEALGLIKGRINFEATIIGDAAADPSSIAEKNKILAAIERNSLQDNIRFVGFMPHNEMIGEAFKHHIFLSPSVTSADGDSEGGAPVTIIEMAASGMPVVSSEHCDIPEIIIDGKTGLLAPERDAETLSEQLVWLTENPDEWINLTSAARKHIDENYNAVIQGKKLADIYQSMIK